MPLFPPPTNQRLAPAATTAREDGSPTSIDFWVRPPLLATSDSIGLMNLKYAIRLTLIPHPHLSGSVLRIGHRIHACLRLEGHLIAVQCWVWQPEEPRLGPPVQSQGVFHSSAGIPSHTSSRLLSGDQSFRRENRRGDSSLDDMSHLADEGEEQVKFVGPAYITAADYAGATGKWVRLMSRGIPEPLESACQVVQDGSQLTEGAKMERERLLWEVREVVAWQ